MNAPLDRSRFLAEVKSAFPELAPEINAQHGQLHFEVSALRQYVERKIADGDREVVARIFSVAEKFYFNGDAKLKNAIDVSFVEEMNFTSSKKCDRRWAWDSFPDELKQLYVAFHGAEGGSP